MSLNLISDPWIPVLDADGERRSIAPWQVAGPDLVRPDWPRADLNVACLELLIGLVFLADPPQDEEDWEARLSSDPDRLRARLDAFVPAFALSGDGPLFLQDSEPLGGEPKEPDMLFIDSAGDNTAHNNADLMVHRRRYPTLDPALAAMALYTFQAHAPTGGTGNRTSMRGGGPLVTLVDPRMTLWDLIWANVPCGRPGRMEDLPWMRPTRVSDEGQETHPPAGAASFGVEAFFGMPRRLRLVWEGGLVTGVIQKRHGTHYAGWKHPLTPYYRMKPGGEWLPVHPRAGLFGYRHWLGILAEGHDGSRERAACLRSWDDRRRIVRTEAKVIVAGWAMDNMKPRDFTLSVQPCVDLPADAALMLAGLVEAAAEAALVLRGALAPVLAEGESREAEREAFHAATEGAFRDRFDELKDGAAPADVAGRWLSDLRRRALAQFDALALPGLDQRDIDVIARIVSARSFLLASFRGHGKHGGAMFDKLMLARPAKKKRTA